MTAPPVVNPSPTPPESRSRAVPRIVTRFAPSPTGRLHLGHAYSAILAHDRARAAGGRFLLRIEDIDGTRSRSEHVAGIEADLAWLRLEWDGPVLFQSARLGAYAAALEQLRDMGLLYPCFCTRAEIAASVSAPHGPEAVYPGTCRGLAEAERAGRVAAGEAHAWRLDMAAALRCVAPDLIRGPSPGLAGGSGLPPTLAPAEAWAPARGRGDERAGLWWYDELAGWTRADPLAHGDVVLARKDAPASYHLAVTLDDAAQGISHVVRGRDLFAATHVHRLLQALLGLPTPAYRHHALLAGEDGRRLAKRDGAPSLEQLRAGRADGRALADGLRAGIGFSTVSA